MVIQSKKLEKLYKIIIYMIIIYNYNYYLQFLI